MNTELELIANDLLKKGNIREAEDLLKRVVANDTSNLTALFKLAKICLAKNDLKNASIVLNAGIKAGGGVEFLSLFAFVKEQLYELYDAIVMYEQLLELEPSEFLYEKIGNLYIAVELYDDAINIAVEHTKVFPTILAYRRLFLLYLNLSKNNKLKDLYADISVKFGNQGIGINLMGMYKEYIDKDFNEAKKLYERASKLGSPTASYDLASYYKKAKQYDEAEKWFKKSLAFFPNKGEVYKSLADIYFIQKKMRKGYKYHLERPLFDDVKRLKNKWNGKLCDKETVLVYADMSDSEIVRNSRYLAFLKGKFKKIIFAVSEKLCSFFEYNKFSCVARNDVASIKYDKYVLLSELPYYLNMSFENIPKLKLKSEKKDLDGKFKVGLFWCALSDSFKSTTIESVDISKYLSEILDNKDIEFYSFQTKDIFNVSDKYKNIHDLSESLETYKDYAEYIKSMDLVISIDDFVLHIAGALGIPTLAMLCYDSEWYWFDNEEKTEWYPSVKIFRRKIKDEWNIISDEIIKEVKKLSKK